MLQSTLDPESVAQALSIGDFDAATQAGVLDRVSVLLNERVGIRIESGLTGQELKAFAKLGDDQAALQAFIEQSVPDIATIYQEELNEIIGQLRSDLGLA